MNLQIFKKNDFEIRTLEEDGQVWFMGTDVATALGYANPRKAIIDHCLEDGVTNRYVIDSLGREQEAKFINEGNLYRLIVHSKLPSAVQFEKWIFEEVLPTIRKHGTYMTPEKIEEILYNPDSIIKIALALKEEREKNKLLTAQNAKMLPKAVFADSVSASKTSILIGDLAKLLKQNGVETGQKRLFEWMRENGWLIKSGNSKNMPTQKAMERELYEVKESTVNNPDGSIRVTKTTKVTGKGQIFFINTFMAA